MSMTTTPTSEGPGLSSSSTPNRPQAEVRLYSQRASYNLPAALSILTESPVSHVAFIHPGVGKSRERTIMNIPLIIVGMIDPDIDESEVDEGDEGSWAIYLHTHAKSGLVEAVESGIQHLTASTIIVDGMVLSPTAHDHSLNYRSATFHLSQPKVLSSSIPSEHEEKRSALSSVTNTVAGYSRTDTVGEPTDPNVKRTTVVKCKIAAVSCKQRYGAFSGGEEPDFGEGLLEKEREVGFTGVVPCWTEWGRPLGYGKDEEEVKEHFRKRSEGGKRFADGVAWASEGSSMEGLGKRRKPKTQ